MKTQAIRMTVTETTRVGEFELRPASRVLCRQGRELKLSEAEFNLLAYLLTQEQEVLSRKALLDDLWNILVSLAEVSDETVALAV